MLHMVMNIQIFKLYMSFIKYKEKNSKLKEERKQKDELYSSLEMAKKLIPLLEGSDEEISQKTGLDINLIRAIRNK